MTAISEKKMDTDSSTCSPSTRITDECRSARNKISAARERYLERIQLGSRRKIRCKRAEMLMILEYYQVHSGNYDSIVNDILNRRSELPEDAAELYSGETPKFMLRSRVKNQIYLFPSKKKYIQDEEMSRKYEAVHKMQEDASKGTEQSNTTAPLTKDKLVDGAAVSEVPEAEFNDETKKYKYPFENLVLQGGGMKGIAYCGLIKVLEEHGILQQMKRFAGTSAGAITAALLAVGYNSSDAGKVLGVDFEKLVYDSSRLMYPLNLLRGYGVNTGERFDRFIGDLLALKTGNPDVTFEEVYVRFEKELCLVVVNVDTSEEMYCHVKTTPEMPVRLAVRMSMSIPGLFQAVKYKDSYFVDGGLLCNYPIHCFDGWFLSMEMENAFLNKIPSLDDLQEITSLENSFIKGANNETTIGGMVYCEGEYNLYRKMLEKSTGVPLGKLPDTSLARKYKKRKAYGRVVKEINESTVKAVVEFYEALTDYNKDENRSKKKEVLDDFMEDFTVCQQDHFRSNKLKVMSTFFKILTVFLQDNSKINKKIFMEAFQKQSFTDDYKTLLFGDGCDPATVWVAVDKSGHGEIQFRDITSFIESIGVSMLGAFKGRERKNTSNLLAFSGSMILGLNESTMQHFFKNTDVERSVGINTWYVQTTNFKLEEGDKQFLTDKGRHSTLKFLKQFALSKSLKILTEKEKKAIVNSKSVYETELEKIIEVECTVSLTLTDIVIANIPLLLVWGLLYVVKN